MEIDHNFDLQINNIKDLKDLQELSDLNKRKDANIKLKAYLNDALPEDLRAIDWSKAGSDRELIPWADGRSYEDVLREVFMDMGKKMPEEAPATEFIMFYDDSFPCLEDYWQKAVYNFFCKQFGETNILSMMWHPSSEKQPHCHIIVCNYPKFSYKRDDFESFQNDHGFIIPKECEIKDEQGNTVIPWLDTLDSYKPLTEYTPEYDKELVYDAQSLDRISSKIMSQKEQDEAMDSFLNMYTTTEKRELKQAQTGELDKKVFLHGVEDFFRLRLKLSEEQTKLMIKKVESAVFGYYVLDELLNDDSISDIKVLSPYKIRVKKSGKRMTSNLLFRGDMDYYRFITGVADKNKTDLSPMNAVQNFTDKTSNKNCIMRLNICTPYVNSGGYPYLHIRKVSKEKRDMEYLLNAGMLDIKTASYLIDMARNATGMLFTGKGASGKTTLMNTLIDYIPYNRSGLCIQENEELYSTKHPDIMFQHIVTPRTPKGIRFTLQDLARNGLLTDLDYFIIGEIKGGEARDFLNAAYTGHQCWASVHGASSTEAIDKLADYVKLASDYSKAEAMSMLRHLQVVVFLKNFKVDEISEIEGWDDEKQQLKYKLIYKRKRN